MLHRFAIIHIFVENHHKRSAHSLDTQNKALVKSDLFMTTIVEKMKEIVVIFDARGRLIYFNKAAEKYMTTGLFLFSESADYCNRELFHADGKTIMAPAENPILRAVKGEKVANEEVWVIPKGKPLSILQVNAKTIFDKVQEASVLLVECHDITEQRWAQQRLAVRMERYKSLIDYNPDIVCWLDLNGNILSINPATEKITGYRKDELLNRPVKQFVLKKEWRELKRNAIQAMNGKLRSFEMTILEQEGESLFLHITIVPMTVENRVVGMYAIAKDITARKKDEQMIHYLAYHDTLTALPNRRFLQKTLTEYLQMATQNISILFIGLDRFKLINDTLGHTVGDTLLKQVAERLLCSVRMENSVFRFGGDEFIIILPKRTKETTEKEVKCLLNEFARPFDLDGQEYIITPSIGISSFPIDGHDADHLIRKADTAMHHAKKLGKNTYQFYTKDMDEPILRKMKIEKELHNAIEQEQFVIHYQPQVNANEHMVGMEALIRWQHPELGLVSPMEFIPVAEETGLIIPIGKWVLLNACKQGKLWQEAGLPPVRVAVNLSPRQFHDEKLVSMVEEILKETKFDPLYLELEITENMAMQEGTHVIAKLQELKKLGLKISIDDFGTGYSSLSYLQKFPLDTLKIDRSFIKSLTSGSDELAIVKAIIVMAKSLNLKVLAEGVELIEQKNLLFHLGCNEIQGYLYGKPMPYEQLVAEYQRNKLFSL